MTTAEKFPKSPIILITTLSILVVATLVVATSYFLRPGIEIELKKRLAVSFAKEGLASSMISISGRDVTLNGIVANYVTSIKAEKTARKIWGIREVNNHLLINN